jgi:hypothetical protein
MTATFDTTGPEAPARLFGPLPLMIVALWGAAVLGGQMATPGPTPVPLPALLAGPPAAFLVALALRPDLRAWVRGLDPALLIGTQAWRVVGLAFLFVWGFGHLPATFAWPAGLGDAAVGLAAVWVALMLARRAPGARRAGLALTLAGVADFALALSTAGLSQAGWPLHLDGAPLPLPMQDLPMILIPGFLVPLFLILHIMAWLRLRAAD